MPLAPTFERPRSSQHSGPSSSTDARPKTILFCACGREAPPHAWQTEHDGRRRRLVCPDCGETITVR